MTIKPECIVWEITLKCNAKCLHCGSAAGYSRNDELTTDLALKVCDQIAETGCKNVNILGGELFLRDDWSLILSRLYQNSIKVSVITNGIALNQENIRILKKNNVQSLAISIDAGTAETNDTIRGVPGLFGSIFEKLPLIAKEDLELSVISTLHKQNILELPQMLNIFSKSPFKVWQVQMASSHGRMTQDLVLDEHEYYISGLFLARARNLTDKNNLAIIANHDFGYYSSTISRHTIYDQWLGCPAGKSTIGIRSNGIVQGCLSLDYEKFATGNLKQDTLKDILKSAQFCDWNTPESRVKNATGFCNSCQHLNRCLCGCPDVAYSLTGNISHQLRCYHAIESQWLNKQPCNDFEWIFKGLTQSNTNDAVEIYLYGKTLLNNDLINKYELSSKEKLLLEILI